MSTPPPLAIEEDSRKENCSSVPSRPSPIMVPSLAKNPTPVPPETPFKQFELNLLPVPDFQTPELQRYRSILKKS